MEDQRALYMFDVIQATGELEFYAEHIRDWLQAPPEGYCIPQILQLNAMLAKAGDEQARQAVYDTYHRNRKDWYTTDSEPLVKMDGIDGYLVAAKVLLKYPISDNVEDDRNDIDLLDLVEQQCGRKKVRAAIDLASKDNPRIGTYYNQIRQQRAKWNAARLHRRHALSFVVTYQDIQELISDPEFKKYRLLRSGKFADDETIARVAVDLVSETDRDVLRKLLQVFSDRKFPLDHTPLLNLARSDDQEIAIAARVALCNISHPTVRELALELSKTEARPWEIIDLLTLNYKNGDYTMIEELAQADYSAKDFHRLALSIRDFVKVNPSLDTSSILMILYETDYCTWCRRSVMESLLDFGPLPYWMIEEGLYDAYDETRELAAHLKSLTQE